MESRSASDLEAALAGAAGPIAVIDLDRRPRAGLDDLDHLVQLDENQAARVVGALAYCADGGELELMLAEGEVSDE